MDRQQRGDIAAFPELFEGMEQFIEEQAAGFKRTGTLLALLVVSGSSALFFALGKLA